MELDSAHVRTVLARLRAAQPQVFGADKHRFELNTPLPEAEVAAFEREYKVELPLDYRRFLTGLGNGGAGPFYGIFPLGRMDNNSDFARGKRTMAWSANFANRFHFLPTGTT